MKTTAGNDLRLRRERSGSDLGKHSDELEGLSGLLEKWRYLTTILLLVMILDSTLAGDWKLNAFNRRQRLSQAPRFPTLGGAKIYW